MRADVAVPVCALSHSAQVCVSKVEGFCAQCWHWLCVCVLQYESSGLGLISSRLRTTLNRIQESLIDMVRLSVPLPLLLAFFLPLSVLLSLYLIACLIFWTILFPLHPSYTPLFFHHIHPRHMYGLVVKRPQPVSPQNALWVVIIWPVVTHAHTTAL